MRPVAFTLVCLAPLLAACESSMRLPPLDNPFGRSERVTPAPAPQPRLEPTPTERVDVAPLPSVTRQDLAPPPGAAATPPLNPIDPDPGIRNELPPIPPTPPVTPPVVPQVADAAPARPTQSALTGTWQAREASGSACRVTLSSSPKLDLYNASSSGCQSRDLQRVTAWELRGDDVYLYEPGGAVAARFKAQSRQMNGTLSKSGAPLSLSR
ncbi:MAG TPA: AprI/Inh family metalloprotease inhibitor [Beijerinckiaceae bacterium]|nr:AprI/Inh family metalloprotease inhibitor [Beijerinckiaceae bacterium]